MNNKDKLRQIVYNQLDVLFEKLAKDLEDLRKEDDSSNSNSQSLGDDLKNGKRTTIV